MNEYITTEIRTLDNLPLGKVAGCQYYEQRLVLRVAPDGTRGIVGKASDWPLIKLQATNTELTQLLTATLTHVSESEQHVARLSADLAVSEEFRSDSECHVSELIARQTVYERHIAALEQALREAEPPPQIAPTEAEQAEAAFVERTELVLEPIPPQIAQLVERLQTPRTERDSDIDGKIPCDYPECTQRVRPNGLAIHKRKTHGVVGLTGHKGKVPDPTMDNRRKCPHCTARPKMEGMQAHIARKHPEQITIVAAPTIALTLGERPWRCANPTCSGAFARSVNQPDLCIKCVVAQTDAHLSNGHQVAA